MDDFVMSARAIRGGAFAAEVGPSKFLLVPEEDPTPDPKQAITAAAWYKAVRAASEWKNAAGEDRGDILFVVHGFNNSESDVMTRHRLVQSDLRGLGFKGVVVSFDWPSADSALAYLPDRHRAKATAMQLVSDGIVYLAKTQTPDCPVNIHVLGHSTGAYVIREAFDDADDTQLKNSAWNVSQVLLAAGDVSAGSMSSSDGGAAAIYGHCVRVTNYSNRHDQVLDLSNVKRLGTQPRVGRVGLPDDAPSKAINVDCTTYYESLVGNPAVQAADSPAGLPAGVAGSHSWYFGNLTFARDLFQTLIGTERTVIATRAPAGDGHLSLRRVAE